MTGEAGSQPSLGEPSFGGHGYCKEEQSRLQGQLAKKLGPSLISQRTSTTEGHRIAFVETWRLIALANELFGFNGWSNSITSQAIDFVDENDGLYYAGVSTCVRVTLRDGTYHEELGYGMADGLPSKGSSLEKARKEAVADGLKRCLRNFGNALGNCLGDKHYLQWVVNQSDTHPASPANSSSDNLVSELITASQMTPPASESTAASGPATTLDVQQQQFLQFQLQHQNSLTCLQSTPRLGQATLPQQQQQIPLLAPFALAAATGGGGAAGGLATSSAQQLYLVRPVAAQTSGLANPGGILPGNNFTAQRQAHQLQRLHGIFNNVSKMSSTACSVAPAAQGSLPITIQSGNSSTSGMHTVMTNNVIQPLMANHVQGGMMSLHTALSNSQTNFLNNLPNGLACGVQNNLQNSGQSSITNLVVQNCISNSNPKSVQSSVSASNVHHPPSSLRRNTFAKPGPLSKTTKSAVKAVPQYPARDIAPRSSASSHTSGKKSSGADAADIACTTQSCMPRLRVVMPPLEKPVQAASASHINSTRGGSGKGRKRSRTQSNQRETFPSDREPRQKKATIPLVTIHTPLDPKDDLIEVKQETLDEEESSFLHDIEPLKNCEVVMNSYPLRSRDASPKEKPDDAVASPQLSKKAMEVEPCSGATACEELNRSVVADAMSKLYEEGANEEEMDFDRHSDTLRKEVESKRFSQPQSKTAVASSVPLEGTLLNAFGLEIMIPSSQRQAAKPRFGDPSLQKEAKRKMLCKTSNKAISMLGNSNVRKEVEKNTLCKTQDITMVASRVLVDSGRSPKKVSVHIPVSVAHQEKLTLDNKMKLDDDKLIDLPDISSPTAESIKSTSFIQPTNPDRTVRCIKSVTKCIAADEEGLDSTDLLVSKKESLRSLRSVPNSVKECSAKSTSKLRKGCARRTEKECNNRSASNRVNENVTLKDVKTIDTVEEETCGTQTSIPLSSNEFENTDGESKTNKFSEKNDVTTKISKLRRSSMTKEYPTLECNNIFQGQKVESTSESKNKVSSILKRVNYEKSMSPHLGDDDPIPFENSCKDDSSQLKEAEPDSQCQTRPVHRECKKTSIEPSEGNLGDCVKDTEKLNLKESRHLKSDENSNNPTSERANHIVTKELGKSPHSMTEEKNTVDILQNESVPTIEEADPAMDEKPLVSMEYKDLFSQTYSPLSEDENTFTGFTADMCMMTSPQALIDLEMHIKHQKPTVDETEKEKQRTALKLDRQRHFRHNLRIKFKEGGGGRSSAKKSAAAAGRRTSGATTPKLANGHRSEEPTPASPKCNDLEVSGVVEGLDQFATSLGLTPRRLLSDSPVTPPSAFLPGKGSSTSRKLGKSTSQPLLPSSNILMKTLQQPTPSASGDESCSTSAIAPLPDVGADSSSKPSKGVNNDDEKGALTSPGDTEKASTMPTPEEKRVCGLKSSLASSPFSLGDDVFSKLSSPIITTSIPTESKNKSFSKGVSDNSSKPRNSISPEPTMAECVSAKRANNDSVSYHASTLSPLATKEGVSKDREGTSSNGSCVSPSTSRVSSELSQLSTIKCMAPVRLASNDLSNEASSAAKDGREMPISCLEKTHQSSLVNSGVVVGEKKEKVPRSSAAKDGGEIPISCLEKTHQSSSVNSGVVVGEKKEKAPRSSAAKDGGEIPISCLEKTHQSSLVNSGVVVGEKKEKAPRSSAAKDGGEIPISCLEKTHQSSLVNSGVVVGEKKEKAPRSSAAKDGGEIPISCLEKTHQSSSVNSGVVVSEKKEKAPRSNAAKDGGEIPISLEKKHQSSSVNSGVVVGEKKEKAPRNSAAKGSGEIPISCLEKTHQSSSVDSGVVVDEKKKKAPSGSTDKNKPIDDVPSTNEDDSGAQRNGNL